MHSRITASALIAPFAAAALLLAGCGSSGKTAAAKSPAPPPTATMIGRGTPPVAGSTGASGRKRAPMMATGKHDHVDELCSGRDQARYAREGLMCVTGRLKPTQ
jgi:hypothetical protein